VFFNHISVTRLQEAESQRPVSLSYWYFLYIRLATKCVNTFLDSSNNNIKQSSTLPDAQSVDHQRDKLPIRRLIIAFLQNPASRKLIFVA